MVDSSKQHGSCLHGMRVIMFRATPANREPRPPPPARDSEEQRPPSRSMTAACQKPFVRSRRDVFTTSHITKHRRPCASDAHRASRARCRTSSGDVPTGRE